MKEDEWNQILVAVHDEAGGLLRGLRVDYAAELDSLMAFVVGLLRVQFLVRYDPDGKAADASIATDQRFTVFRLVLVETATVEYAGQNFFHVVRARGRRIIDAVDFLRG